MTFLGALPPDLPAAIFIVLHVRPDIPSQLPAILNRAGQIPVAHAVDSEPIRRSRVYVAPPGMQTYVNGSRIGVRRGPHENLHRPAIDPLFRTAAHHYGSRVVGIILSGAMGDGAAGLQAVKRGGGIAIVQDPDDATFPSMPETAMAAIQPDFCVPVAQLAPIVLDLVGEDATADLRSEIALETKEEAALPDEAKRSSVGAPRR